MRLADVTGDGLDDLCVRAAAGPRCWASTGDGFAADSIGFNGFTDESVDRFATFRVSRPHAVPVPETCNGLDDDLDGLSDEDGICDVDGPGPDDPGAGDGGWPTGDGGTDRPADPMDRDGVTGGGCAAVGAASGGVLDGGPAALLLFLVLFAVRRRRG
jgi:hypothetical protein